MKKIVLASASRRRREILKSLGLDFTVIPSRIREKEDLTLKPELVVQKIALRKAESVAQKLRIKRNAPGNTVVIGADTIVVLPRGDIVGKPHGRAEAREILGKLSGTTHYVYTGIAVMDVKATKKITDYEKSVVKMKKLTSTEIEESSQKHLDKAGSYGIQEKKDVFVTLVSGTFDNVVGLPVKKLEKALGEFITEKKRYHG